MKKFVYMSLFFMCCGSAVEINRLNLLQNTNKYYVETRDADSVIVYWDKPDENSVSVKNYKLYYRPYSQATWITLKDSVPVSDKPSYVVYRNQLNSTDSIVIFGIQAITFSGQTTEIHTSLDSTANSAGGWILVLKKK